MSDELSHTTLSCCHEGCYAVITLHPDEKRRLRRTRETFYCPSGHGQSFTGKTEEQKQIERLERQVVMWQNDANGWRDTSTRYRNALTHDAQTCPIPECGWRGNRRLPWFGTEDDLTRFFERVWSDLGEHLAREHGARIAPQKTGEAVERLRREGLRR